MFDVIEDPRFGNATRHPFGSTFLRVFAAIDGRTLRGSRKADESTVQIVSTWACHKKTARLRSHLPRIHHRPPSNVGALGNRVSSLQRPGLGLCSISLVGKFSDGFIHTRRDFLQQYKET